MRDDENDGAQHDQIGRTLEQYRAPDAPQQAEVVRDPALKALARGDSSAAIEQLGRLDRVLAGLPSAMPGARVRLRACGSLLAMSESLARHAAYFDLGSAR